MNEFGRLIAVLGLMLAATAYGAEPGSPDPAETREPTTEARSSESKAAETRPAPPVAEAMDDEYRIGFSDLLEISVFQIKELDRSVRVNARGLITLPLLGQIKAGGLTASELEDEIARRLQEKYLQDPQVNVFIKEYTSQRVTLEGEVTKAGIYPITGKTSLLQAIAMAGGMKDLADPSVVRVFRLDATGTRQMQVVDMEKVRSGAVGDPLLQNNDIVVVETSTSRSIVKSVTDTIRGLVTFGRF